jgi:hypothetical protein
MLRATQFLIYCVIVIVKLVAWSIAPLPLVEAVTITMLFTSVVFGGEGLAAWPPHEVSPVAKAKRTMTPKTRTLPMANLHRGGGNSKDYSKKRDQ